MKVFTFIITLSLCVTTMLSQQNTFYSFIPGVNAIDNGYGILEKNGIICVININKEVINDTSILSPKINKIDNLGNLIFQKVIKIDTALTDLFGGYNVTDFRNDNNWFITGHTTKHSTANYISIQRLNSTLDSVTRILAPLKGSATNVIGKHVKYINDTSIIVVGVVNFSYTRYIRVMSIDTAANLNWTLDIGSASSNANNNVSSMSIDLAEDGGYFISFMDNPYQDLGHSNMYLNKYYTLAKVSKNGLLEWKKIIRNSNNRNSIPGSVIKKDTNSYLITWVETSYTVHSNTTIGTKGLDSVALWVGEIDLQGEFKWQKSLHKVASNCDTLPSITHNPYSITATRDGNYLISASFRYYLYPGNLIKIRPNGDVIWNRKIEILKDQNTDAQTQSTQLLSIKESLDGGILGVGSFYSSPSTLYPSGITTSILLKLDEQGCLEPGCHLEGCTDQEAINYNPEAVYDCGCQYDPCPGGNSLNIMARHYFAIGYLDYELYPASNPSNILIEHKGTSPDSYAEMYLYHLNQSTCIEDNCDKDYLLHIHYRYKHNNPNYIAPYTSTDLSSPNYKAYFQVRINDSLFLDLGNQLHAEIDTVITINFCKPDTTTYFADFTIFPNPTTGNITVALPKTQTFEKQLSLNIVDMTGRLVKTRTLINTNTPISLTDLATGLYSVAIFRDGELLYHQKLVIS